MGRLLVVCEENILTFRGKLCQLREAGKDGCEFGCENGGYVADPMRCNFTVY